MKIPTIKLKKFFSPLAAGRESAKLLTQELIKELSVSESEEAILDFEDIVFISRSFADEILDSIEMLSKKKIKVRIKNAHIPVRKMLVLVRSQRRKILKNSL